MDVLLEWLLQNASGPSILLCAVIIILYWLKPRAEALFDGHINLVKHLTGGWERTNDLIPIVIGFLQETRRRLVSVHTTLLIIEDSITVSAALEHSLEAVAHKYGLRIITVSSIKDAIPLVHQSRIIILDVFLEDTKYPETTRIFADLVAPPIIVFTSLEDCGRLAGLDIIRKQDANSLQQLTIAVDNKLKESE